MKITFVVTTDKVRRAVPLHLQSLWHNIGVWQIRHLGLNIWWKLNTLCLN